MTYPELQIQFDLNPDNRINVLKNADTCSEFVNGYLFVDQDDGQCYLFDKNGNLDDISKVDRIRMCAFENCTSLAYIKIPESVESIGYCAFEDCTSLKSIKIPSSVEYIGNWAFYQCTSLKSITIPSSVESIGYDAFYDCTSLKEVVFEGKTMKQVKAMEWYTWGIEDESVIKYKAFI